MIILNMILCTTNLILCGVLVGMIFTKKIDGQKVTVKDYLAAGLNFLIGMYLMIALIGAGAQ